MKTFFEIVGILVVVLMTITTIFVLITSLVRYIKDKNEKPANSCAGNNELNEINHKLCILQNKDIPHEIKFVDGEQYKKFCDILQYDMVGGGEAIEKLIALYDNVCARINIADTKNFDNTIVLTYGDVCLLKHILNTMMGNVVGAIALKNYKSNVLPIYEQVLDIVKRHDEEYRELNNKKNELK